MTQAEALYHLQQLELTLMQHQKRLKSITEALQDDRQVQEAQRAATAAAEALAPIQRKMREIEHQVQANADKTRAAEERLYSGAVKNPKELQDIQREIESLKRWRQELEDRLLEAMVATEEAESDLQQKEGALQQATAGWESQNAELLAERSQLETEMADLKKQREAALRDIEPESLKLYSQLRPQKGMRPVALFQNNSCSACGIQMTAAVERDLRAGERFITCTNCGRILVYMAS